MRARTRSGVSSNSKVPGPNLPGRGAMGSAFFTASQPPAPPAPSLRQPLVVANSPRDNASGTGYQRVLLSAALLAAYWGRSAAMTPTVIRASNGDSTRTQASSQPCGCVGLEANFFHQWRHRPICQRESTPAGRRHQGWLQQRPQLTAHPGDWRWVTATERAAWISQRPNGEASVRW